MCIRDSPGTEQFYWEQVYLDMLNGQAKRRLEGEIGKAAEKNSHNPLPDSRLSAALAAAPAMFINRQPADQVYEFENLEELRRFDSRYQNRSNNQAMELVSSVFQVQMCIRDRCWCYNTSKHSNRSAPILQ